MPPPFSSEGRPFGNGFPNAPQNRFYLSGILGGSFATLEMDGLRTASAPLFTSGGAAGMAIERDNGWIRTEFEGRYRDPIGNTQATSLDGSLRSTATNGWSTMLNGWRDYDFSDRFGGYIGGGIGAGGYRMMYDGSVPPLGVTLSGNSALTGFAWQAGTGVTWVVTDYTTLDLGYRYYTVNTGPSDINVNFPGISYTESIGTRFGTNELLLTIRFYEPFRRRRP